MEFSLLHHFAFLKLHVADVHDGIHMLERRAINDSLNRFAEAAEMQESDAERIEFQSTNWYREVRNQGPDALNKAVTHCAHKIAEMVNDKELLAYFMADLKDVAGADEDLQNEEVGALSQIRAAWKLGA